MSRYQVPLGAAGSTEGVAVSPDGSVAFLTGSFKEPPAGPKFVTVAYNAATGAQLWAQTAQGSTAKGDIAASPDGSAVLVSGTVPKFSGGSSVTTTAYAAATGTQLWTRRFHGRNPDNAPNAVTVSPDGSRLFVTGQSSGSTALDITTVAYATASGATLWSRSQPSGQVVFSPIGGVAIGVSPDGTLVFVTGGSHGSTRVSENFTTIAYRTGTGQTAWLARYKGPRGFAAPTSLAVGPTGQGIFVTGSIGVHDGCCNFGTVAYQP